MKFIWNPYGIIYYISLHIKIKVVDLRGQLYEVQTLNIEDGS